MNRLTFHGESVDELKSAMKETVDFYIEVYNREGKAAEKNYSGKLMFRLLSTLHRKIAERAAASGKSINEWGKEIFESALK